jgi:hypothetical protein
MTSISFDDFVTGLTALGSATQDAKAVAAQAREVSEAATVLLALPEVTAATLARLVQEHPTWVPYLASCVGLGREQLKRQLQHRLGSSGWITLARRRPEQLVDALDRAYGLVRAITEQRAQAWTFADVLVERAHWSQRSASQSISRGRRLEDVVEEALRALGLPYEMRARFSGQHGQDAPCDFAVPAGGEDALIVGAVKGFDSTGSKLSDAVREIERMTTVRLPRQFVFAFVDGIGWLGRKADLRRIYQLWTDRAIDGLYSLSRRDQLHQDLAAAARRLGLVPTTSRSPKASKKRRPSRPK